MPPHSEDSLKESADTRAPKRARVLLAEDNQVNQQVAIALLKKRGYEIDAVSDGKLAVEAVQKRAYDIVLMDIQMPVMDGLEATRVIRKPIPTAATPCPSSRCTAHAFAEDQRDQTADQAGMNDFLAKPFKPEGALRVSSKAWMPSRRFPIESDASPGAQEIDPGRTVKLRSSTSTAFRAVMREVGESEQIVDVDPRAIYRTEAPEIFGASRAPRSKASDAGRCHTMAVAQFEILLRQHTEPITASRIAAASGERWVQPGMPRAHAR